MHGSTLIILVSLDWLSGSVGDCTVSAGVWRRVPLYGGGGLTGEGGGDGLGGLVPKRASHGGDTDHHHGACLSSAGGGGGGGDVPTRPRRRDQKLSLIHI